MERLSVLGSRKSQARASARFGLARVGLDLRRVLIGCCGALAGACSDSSDAPDETATRAQPIIGGEADVLHEAVVVLLSETGLCSGTVVDADAVTGVGYVLTAAHCVEEDPPVVAAVGTTLDDLGQELPVEAFWMHPEWELQGQIYDLALVRVLGVTAETPVIPLIEVEQDTVTAGSSVTSVGWGRVTPEEDPNAVPERRSMQRQVTQADDYWLVYEGLSPQICFGDSGGPVLVDTPLGERVVGVHSGTAAECTDYGISIRVTTALDSFLNPLIEDGEVPVCDACVVNELNVGGACNAINAACESDPECFFFDDCVGQCTTALCDSQCAGIYPKGAALSIAVSRCLCDAAHCGGDCGCAESFAECGVALTGEATCEACGTASCCEEEEACFADGACAWCSEEDPTCANNPRGIDLLNCATQACATECGLTPLPPTTATAPAPLLTGTREPPAPLPAPTESVPLPAPEPAPQLTASADAGGTASAGGTGGQSATDTSVSGAAGIPTSQGGAAGATPVGTTSEMAGAPAIEAPTQESDPVDAGSEPDEDDPVAEPPVAGEDSGCALRASTGKPRWVALAMGSILWLLVRRRGLRRRLDFNGK